MVYLIFAMTLYLLPPKSSGEGTAPKKTTERTIQRGHDGGKFTSLGRYRAGRPVISLPAERFSENCEAACCEQFCVSAT